MTGAQTGATPKLRRSSFSFVGARVAKPTLKADTTSVDIQLQETNRILIEIQKQLALDFGNRIVEKKQTIRASKIQVTRERAASKESAIEAMRNSGAGFLKVVDKVVAPVKGIFQRILDFFSIILTGLLVNNAFKWLENPANRAKLEKFFNFVVNHWKELLALYGTYKLIKIVGALKMVADLFKKPPKWPGGGSGGSKGGSKGGGSPPGPTGCGAIAGCGVTIVAAVLASGAALMNLSKGLIPNLIPLLLRDPSFAAASDPNRVVSDYVDDRSLPTQDDLNLYPPQLRPFMQWATGWRRTEAGRKIEELEATVGLLTAVFGGVRGLKGLKGGLVQQPGTQLYTNTRLTAKELEALASGSARTSPQNIIDIVKGSKSKSRIGASTGGTIPGFSLGGTVGGTGSGSVDSVSAMLAPGEEVIRASAAMLFRPLLKDINNNAGRLWTSFSGAIINLMRSNNELEGGIRTLKGQLDVFKQQLDQFISDEKLKKEPEGGGIGRINPPRMSGMVAPEVVLHSDIKNPPKRRAKSTVVNVPLPPQTLPPTNVPKFSADGGVANEVPSIESVNLLNPYMQLTPQLLGIFV